MHQFKVITFESGNVSKKYPGHTKKDRTRTTVYILEIHKIIFDGFDNTQGHFMDELTAFSAAKII